MQTKMTCVFQNVLYFHILAFPRADILPEKLPYCHIMTLLNFMFLVFSHFAHFDDSQYKLEMPDLGAISYFLSVKSCLIFKNTVISLIKL